MCDSPVLSAGRRRGRRRGEEDFYSQHKSRVKPLAPVIGHDDAARRAGIDRIDIVARVRARGDRKYDTGGVSVRGKSI